MMKLRYSTTSPFARKALVLAAETGQDKELELIKTNPSDPATGIAHDNPLNKIPALVLADGSSLYDSRVICEYLDDRHKGRKLFPAAGPARWLALKRQALADGMMDAAVLRTMEKRRPDNQRSPEWDARQKLKVDQGLDALEHEAAAFGAEFDIGLIGIAVMLDYLDFRYATEDWRKDRPNLAKWRAGLAARPSLKNSMPHD